MKENLLFYCKDAADIEPLGALDLEGCELRSTNRGNSFEVPTSHIFLLVVTIMSGIASDFISVFTTGKELSSDALSRSCILMQL